MVRSSPRVTIVTLDQRGSRLSPTESVSMLNPRALNSPTIRDNSPGSSATMIESVWRILFILKTLQVLSQLLCNHVARIGTRRYDRKHVLLFSNDNIDNCNTLMIQCCLEHVA